MKKPFVYLVGAGPGDAGLITLKGMQCLAGADCVIYDGLVNPQILKLAPPGAEKIAVAKRGGKDSIPQEQINDLLVSHAMSGQTVVRLKGGDPTLFARAGEEVKVLHHAGIGFEIIPGITAGIAAAQYSGIFLTDRELSSQVVFVTGHPAAGKELDFIDWDWLGQFEGTIVLYMAMANLDKIVERLITSGKNADTPAAVIQDATLPNQKTAQGILKDIDMICKSHGVASPAIVIIGKTAAMDPENNWFMNKPLFGKTIIVTRDDEGNQRLAWWSELDAVHIIDFPCIEIQGPIESQALTDAIRNLSDYEWVIFTSSHGVDMMFDVLRKKNKDSRAFGASKIACIGDQTAQALTVKFSITADFIPTKYTAQALASQLAEKTDLRRQNVLLLRSAIATDDLANDLRQKGAAVEDIRIYTTVPVVHDDARKAEVAELLKAGKVDWITFTSSSTVEGFAKNIDMEIVKQSNVKIASIGPETTKKLEMAGLKTDIEAITHTTNRLVASIVSYESGFRTPND
jgi:uroporphyrinogen III methyltransferase/synthase